MSQRGSTGRRATRPAIEGLEARSLLSTADSPLLSSLPTTPRVTASTQAPTGDLNPYGVVVIPKGFLKGGPLRPGDILVSNFNGPANLQGTGTSLVSVTPGGDATLFARTQPGTGLSTALGVLDNRFIVVGNLPSTDGTSATAQPGSLLLINRFGSVVLEYSSPALINGPWDLTINQQGSHASIFVSNVLSGTITRVNLQIVNHGKSLALIAATQIASGYAHRGDPAAFEVGPTGLAYDAKSDTLYVASTEDNEIFAVQHAERTRVDLGTGTVIYDDPEHLHGPLGLAFAPNGDLIVANGDAINADPNQPSELVEFTRKGKFVAQLSVNPTPGAAFGLAISSSNKGAQLAAVDDVLNQLDIFNVGKL